MIKFNFVFEKELGRILTKFNESQFVSQKIKELSSEIFIVNEGLKYVPINSKGVLNDNEIQLRQRRVVDSYYAVAIVPLVNKYAWAIPSYHVLKVIAGYSPIIEIGAGNGYWLHLLSVLFNADVLAYDDQSWETSSKLYSDCKLWFDVKKGNESAIENHPSNYNLFLCYPPATWDYPLASLCLKKFKGEYVIYLGGTKGGSTGDDEFFDLLDSHFDVVETVFVPHWPCHNVRLYVLKRRSGENNVCDGNALHSHFASMTRRKSETDEHWKIYDNFVKSGVIKVEVVIALDTVYDFTFVDDVDTSHDGENNNGDDGDVILVNIMTLPLSPQKNTIKVIDIPLFLNQIARGFNRIIFADFITTKDDDDDDNDGCDLIDPANNYSIPFHLILNVESEKVFCDLFVSFFINGGKETRLKYGDVKVDLLEKKFRKMNFIVEELFNVQILHKYLKSVIPFEIDNSTSTVTTEVVEQWWEDIVSQHQLHRHGSNNIPFIIVFPQISSNSVPVKFLENISQSIANRLIYLNHSTTSASCPMDITNNFNVVLASSLDNNVIGDFFDNIKSHNNILFLYQHSNDVLENIKSDIDKFSFFQQSHPKWIFLN